MYWNTQNHHSILCPFCFFLVFSLSLCLSLFLRGPWCTYPSFDELTRCLLSHDRHTKAKDDKQRKRKKKKITIRSRLCPSPQRWIVAIYHSSAEEQKTSKNWQGPHLHRKQNNQSSSSAISRQNSMIDEKEKKGLSVSENGVTLDCLFFSRHRRFWCKK